VLESLLQTKLYIPSLLPTLVPRPRLIERLDHGLELGHKLTLVSAPAGFGKTTLVSEWLAGRDSPSVWLSLDEGDNDPARFLAYIVAALQTISADIGGGISGLLQSAQPHHAESILAALINDITNIPAKFVLVLDDYHVIDTHSLPRLAMILLLEEQDTYRIWQDILSSTRFTVSYCTVPVLRS
jgi:LuxR family maltose regulon positive regulatory protein